MSVTQHFLNSLRHQSHPKEARTFRRENVPGPAFSHGGAPALHSMEGPLGNRVRHRPGVIARRRAGQPGIASSWSRRSHGNSSRPKWPYAAVRR